MPSLNLLVVGDEKALPEFEEALESCKRYVGPIKLFTAHKAVDAVSRLQKLVQTCGQCHAALLSNHFTAPGKEEFSETLRKVIKEKHPDVPVICWGNPKKGGDLNKHFHATLEFAKNGGDVNAVVDILKQLQAGQIRPDYLHKDQRKSLDRRNSIDRSDSIRGAVRTDSILRRTDSRRASTEGTRPPALDRTASTTRRSADPEDHLGMSPAVGGGGGGGGGMHATPTLRRQSMERKGSLEHGVGGPGHMAAPGGGGGGMNPGMGMGMGMAGMHNLGSMNASMGGMNAAGMGMGAMNAGMGMGMGMNGGGMMPGVGMGGGGGFGPMQARMGSMTAAGAGMAMGGGGGGDVMGMMGGMSLGGAAGMAVAAPPVPVPVPAAANPSPNAELIRMLADEVVRLRRAVEEKRARDSEATQLRELQYQQLMLQQQLAAVTGGGGGAGMPMGI